MKKEILALGTAGLIATGCPQESEISRKNETSAIVDPRAAKKEKSEEIAAAGHLQLLIAANMVGVEEKGAKSRGDIAGAQSLHVEGIVQTSHGELLKIGGKLFMINGKCSTWDRPDFDDNRQEFSLAHQTTDGEWECLIVDGNAHTPVKRNCNTPLCI